MRLFCSIALCLACFVFQAAKAAAPGPSIFDKSNLNAWCIVPFDKAKRGPEARAAMLEKLGLKKFIYDYRAEHVPTFDAELDALKKHGIELTGWWFPTKLNDEAKMTLELFKRHGVKPQLWVNGGGDFPKGPEDHQKRIQAEVDRLRPIAEAAAAQGLTVGLYNHGGWYGEPETQLEIIDHLKMPNVGMVYNLHHGHDHLHRFERLLHQMLPHLLCLNLNGMTEEGDKKGMLIMPLGQGEWDLELMKIISRSGYKGPIGILNHTDEDAEERLQDNLDGLQWLVKQLDGSAPGPAPVPRSWKRPPPAAKKGGASLEPGVFGKALRGGLLVEGKAEYRARPFTIECRAKLEAKTAYNILVACDEKSSGDHWELYTQAGSGRLALHQHGRGDRTTASQDVCDGKWHTFAAIVETDRLRLFSDGEQVLDSPWNRGDDKPKPGGLAFGRLVEGTIGCAGVVDDVRLSKGVRDVSKVSAEPVKADAQTLGIWSFDALEVKKPAPTPSAFLYNYDPLEPRLWPNRENKVNRFRLYDFYAKEALHFMKQSPQPGLVAAYPGLEGGRFGHWGVADDSDWKDGRWRDAERRPVQAGVLFAPGGSYPKAVVMELGGHHELTSFFDPLTLSFPMVAGDQFVSMSDGRHGFMNGIRFASPVIQRLDQVPGDKPTVYHGYYRHGSRVVFSYRRDGKEMLDSAWTNGPDFARETGLAETSPLRDLIKGGPAQWPQWLETQGELGTGRPYALDTITLPKETPWRHPWFVSGHDFFANGDAAICTMTGDVWIVRGIDGKLDKLRWRRFASGLNQPLGLRIVEGKICVQGRDQITRLHDLNGDDEADFYECVTNAQKTSPSGHDFITGCEFDGTYFYYASGNEGVCRVKPGSPVEVLGTGFRNPNGLGLAKDGTLTTSVQEGDWTPASMILQITRPGGYYGHGGPKPGKTIEPPLAYLPRGMDNSAGGQCFADSDRWGPLSGQLIHFSPGSANHFLVLRQKVDEVTQGAVVCLPGDFLSGAQEGRINAKDGQLYVTGMYGWGCWGRDDGCFQRVRYTGGEAHLPVAFEAHENGVLLRFSDALGSVAGEARSHFAQCWNYHYSAAYGSAEYSLRHPDVEGHDTLAIKSAHVLPDGKSLFLEIPLLTPANQVHLHVGTTDKTFSDVIITAHRLAPAFTGFPGCQPAAKEFIVAEDARIVVAKKDNPWAQGAAGRSLIVQAAQGLQYVQRELHAKAGERLSLTFNNPDVVPHNWALIRPGKLNSVGELANKLIADPNGLARHYVPESSDVLVYADMTNPGGSFTIHFDAPKEPGRYPYLCTFPGHWMVMNGVLTVE